jgi:xylulokinase
MANDKIIGWDLGTGGNKASLYDTDGNCLAAVFVPYATSYPQHGWHEQKPLDWWNAVVQSTRTLLTESEIDKNDVVCCGISGHSLGAVPIGKDGRLLRESTPIWSDGRATEEAAEFFAKIDEPAWYMTTGNGFPPQFYTVFKAMWYRKHEPELYKQIDKIIGTKDYINFRLTGRAVTDHSYASGSGIYDLNRWSYAPELVEASGIAIEKFPQIVPSTEIIGEISAAAAEELGLGARVQVVAGGVDNSCMALGAKAYKEGHLYNSLGSCSWIAVSSSKPLLNVRSRPYVFTHVVKGMYASALCITCGGSSYRWIRDAFCKDLSERADREGCDVYDLMTEEARQSPLGAKKLLFNPSLGGGMALDKSINIRGAYMGLDLGHTRADLLRAAMEGISFGLRACLDELRNLTPLSNEMLIVGGGSKSSLWRQIYADIYNMKIVKTSVDQQAAALGAAAVAAVGTGIWKDFDKIDEIHKVEQLALPVAENVASYNRLFDVFQQAGDGQSELGDRLWNLSL